MRIRHPGSILSLFLLWVIVFLIASSTGAGEQGPGLNAEVGNERTFLYTAKKLGLPALKATLHIGNGYKEGGKPRYMVWVNVISLTPSTLFFRMKNSFTSMIEADSFSPIRYIREIDQEGLFLQKKHYTEIVTFDPLRHKATVEKKGSAEKREVFFPSEACDPLAMFARYHLKEGLPLDTEVRMSIFDGVRFRSLLFQTKGSRFSSKVLGEVEAVLLESTMAFSSFGDREGILRIWYSADRNRIPLCMELVLPIGLLRFELEEIRES